MHKYKPNELDCFVQLVGQCSRVMLQSIQKADPGQQSESPYPADQEVVWCLLKGW